ncbi:hypothetical protein FQR65_LT20631 [Abscondita terminalis]|nr:hypothetical protein FQR65_LT20631 [Abscondita terminalis]
MEARGAPRGWRAVRASGSGILMRYMMLLHGTEAEFQGRGSEWIEESVKFLARFEDDLASRSELEWTEVLGSAAHAETVGPDGEPRTAWFNAAAVPVLRVWVVRVPHHERARELAGSLAAGLGASIEVRECLSGAQRPLVTLEPLALEHHDALCDAVRDGEVWRLWYTRVPAPDAMDKEIRRRLELQEGGSMLPFAARRNDTGKVIGMTTFMNIDAETPRVEIGSTWNALSAQGSGTNPESKLLLLQHAFEQWGCTAVEFRTDFHNHQSREAIARLGARQDGILRAHTRARGCGVALSTGCRGVAPFGVTEAHCPVPVRCPSRPVPVPSWCPARRDPTLCANSYRNHDI